VWMMQMVRARKRALAIATTRVSVLVRAFYDTRVIN
jgi:hypothetical protein